MVSFFGLHLESFFTFSFPCVNHNILLNETDTIQAQSGRINAKIIHFFSSRSHDKTMEHLSDQCSFECLSGVEMLNTVLATVQCKKKSLTGG